MKILSLSNCPLDEAQGSGYVIVNYARRLRERGHQVDLLGPDEIELPRGGRRAIRYRQALGMAVVAWRRRTDGYDVFEFYGGEAWLAITLLRRARRRPILVAHSNGLEPLAALLLQGAREDVNPRARRRWYHWDLSRLYALAFRGAEGVATVSAFDRAFAIEAGYQPPAQVVAIENPLPDSYLDQAIDPERPPAAVFCGSWIARKGNDLLRQDGTAFLVAHRDWKLVLVGVGRDFRTGEHFPPSVAGRIEVVASVDREQGLKAIYRRCRIAIQASRYESFGLAAAEAMACGCALVATRVGFAAALADGCEALLLPSAESPHLAAALARLAADEPLRRSIAAAGHGRVQALRWAPAVERLEAAYLGWVVARARRGER